MPAAAHGAETGIAEASASEQVQAAHRVACPSQVEQALVRDLGAVCQ